MPPKRATATKAPATKKAASKKRPTNIVTLTPEALMKAINKQMGEGTMKMASDPSLRITRIPTGVLSIDHLTGGGWPRNRYIEIFGSAHVGKTYLAMISVATAQALGLRCAWIECENTWDPVWASLIGIDLGTLAYHEQEHGHKVVDFMEALLRSGLYDLIVLDSIASLLPEPELAANMSAGSYGTEQARLMSKGLRKLTAANKRTVVLMLNQQREAIGVTWGKKTTEPGGRAPKHYAGIRIEVNRVENITRPGKRIDTKNNKSVAKKNIVIGHRVVVIVEKDKTGGSRPKAETTFVFSYTKKRHEHIEDLMYLGRVYDLIGINPSEKWWVIGHEDEMVHGRPAFKKWLRKNRKIREELEEKIIAEIVARHDDDDDG